MFSHFFDCPVLNDSSLYDSSVPVSLFFSQRARVGLQDSFSRDPLILSLSSQNVMLPPLPATRGLLVFGPTERIKFFGPVEPLF